MILWVTTVRVTETRRVADLKPHAENEKIYGDHPDAEFVHSVKIKGILEPLLITFDDRTISGHRPARRMPRKWT